MDATATHESDSPHGRDEASFVAALDLLAHYWSRPTPDEVNYWHQRALRASGPGRAVPNRLRLALPLPGSLQEAVGLLDEHERLFVGPGEVPCPPYESSWRTETGPNGLTVTGGVGHLRRIYRRLGLAVGDDGAEPPDHAAVELEALAYALSFAETAEAGHQLLFEHLSEFLPRLCRAVRLETTHAFYRELADVTLEWLDEGIRLLSTTEQP